MPRGAAPRAMLPPASRGRSAHVARESRGAPRGGGRARRERGSRGGRRRPPGSRRWALRVRAGPPWRRSCPVLPGLRASPAPPLRGGVRSCPPAWQAPAPPAWEWAGAPLPHRHALGAGSPHAEPPRRWGDGGVSLAPLSPHTHPPPQARRLPHTGSRSPKRGVHSCPHPLNAFISKNTAGWAHSCPCPSAGTRGSCGCCLCSCPLPGAPPLGQEGESRGSARPGGTGALRPGWCGDRAAPPHPHRAAAPQAALPCSGTGFLFPCLPSRLTQ